MRDHEVIEEGERLKLHRANTNSRLANEPPQTQFGYFEEEESAEESPSILVFDPFHPPFDIQLAYPDDDDDRVELSRWDELVLLVGGSLFGFLLVKDEM